MLAPLRWRRRRILALKLAAYSYREIMEMLVVTCTNVNRHLSEGRAELRRRARRELSQGGMASVTSPPRSASAAPT
jgi:DNA-directed RNA polymerase specialized sigma24 family protein